MPIFLPQERGTRLLWTTRFGQPHSFLVLPPGGESGHHCLFFLGGCFLKKKARSPLLKGFGVDFSAVLKFTGQQYKTIVGKKHERVFLRTVVLFVASDLYAQIQVAVHHGIDNNV